MEKFFVPEQLAIVAWHEVPGAAPPRKRPSRRVRCDSCRCAHLWDEVCQIIPYPTGRFFRGMCFQALRARLRSVVPPGQETCLSQTELNSAPFTYETCRR